MANFGYFIKQERERHGWTQTDLGARLGINSGAISKIEHGRKQLSSNKLSILAELFDVDILYLKGLYFGEKFAREVYKNGCPETVFQIAASTYQDIRTKNIKQGKINF